MSVTFIKCKVDKLKILLWIRKKSQVVIYGIVTQTVLSHKFHKLMHIQVIAPDSKYKNTEHGRNRTKHKHTTQTEEKWTVSEMKSSRSSAWKKEDEWPYSRGEEHVATSL